MSLKSSQYFDEIVSFPDYFTCRMPSGLTVLQDVITYRGQNVYPSEVENILLSHPAVVDAAVIGVSTPSDSRLDVVSQVPRGFVVIAPGGRSTTPTVTVQELLDSTNYKFESHKDLKWQIQIIEAIPRSPAGKILRRQLQNMADQV